MSIFTKDCPQCAETNAAYAVRCKCGFAFSADAADTEAQTEEETALEEEKLYQEYLAARARQESGVVDDAAELAGDQPADGADPKEAEDAKAAADSAQTEPKTQTTPVVEDTPERSHVPAEPAATPAAVQTANEEAAPPAPKAPALTPPVQTTVPAVTTQTPVPKPAAEADQSWLISGAESDEQFDAPTELRAVKPATTTSAKPATSARPASTAANVDAAKVSAAERAKKLEQRLKAVQAKRDSKAPATGVNAPNKVNTNSAAAKPNPDSTGTAATPHPPATPAAPTPVPVKDPAASQTSTAPTAAKTDDTTSAPSPSKLTSLVRKVTSMVLDTKSAQPQAVDEKPTPEPKKVNGTDTVPPASDTIEVPAAKDEARTPSTTATAKADLEAALQALHTKTPETNPTIPTPAEGGNGADKAGTVPEELLDTNAQAPSGDLNQKGGLGCTEKECPNCTALVPMDAESCRCGFGFPTEDDAMPSLSLSDSDVEALEKRKKSSSISHLGK